MTTHNTNQDGLKALDEILCEHLHPDRPDNITPTEMLQTFNPGLLEAIQDYAHTIALEVIGEDDYEMTSPAREKRNALRKEQRAKLNTLIGGGTK